MKTLLSVFWNPILKQHCIGSTIDGASEIAAWMSDDLPQGDKSIEYWINKFNAVSNGDIKGGYLGSGNAHNVRAVGKEVFLECQFDDEMKVFLTIKQILSALDNYRNFVCLNSGDQSQKPPPFEVEYEAVGEDAFTRYLNTGGTLGL